MITITWLKILLWLSAAVAVDGVIKAVAVKNGYTTLASACSFIADHIQVVIDIIKGILALGIQLTAKKPVSSVIGSAPTVAK